MSLISLSINFDSDLYAKITPEYEAGNYTSAIKTAILVLTEEIRERSDLDNDGDTLVTKAFSEKNPLIKVNKLETETDKSEQIGYMFMLQGLYKAIRNPRNHNLKEDTKESCDDILVMVNYFLKIVKASKTKFDYQEFSGIVKDKYFVSTAEYSAEIIKKIPCEKYLEVVQKFLEEIESFPVNNIAWLLYSIKKELSGENYKTFITLIDNVLQRSDNINIVRASTIILQNDWKDISVATKIRTENILLESFRHMEIRWETGMDQYNNYQQYSYPDEDGVTASYIRYIPFKSTHSLGLINMKLVIEETLKKGDDYVDFVFTNFEQYLIRNGNYINEAFNDVISNQLKSTSTKLYQILTSGSYSDDSFDPNYEYSDDLSKAINALKEKKMNF